MSVSRLGPAVTEETYEVRGKRAIQEGRCIVCREPLDSGGGLRWVRWFEIAEARNHWRLAHERCAADALEANEGGPAR